MNVFLWILQVLLAVLFVVHAYVMLRPSLARTQSGMKFIIEMPTGVRLFAGVAEGLAGFALVLPAVFGILTLLTPVAAAGLVLLMLGAIVFHLMRREYPNIGLNAALGALAAVVLWGRFGPYHF
jgi:CBS-domain-containing membrane protein